MNCTEMDRNSNANQIRVNSNSILNSNSVNNNLPLISNTFSNSNINNINNNGLNAIKTINNINKSHVIKDKCEPNANKLLVNSQSSHRSSKASNQSSQQRQGSTAPTAQLTTGLNPQKTDHKNIPTAYPLMDRTPCGSASLTPHFDQSYDTPPQFRWGQDFHYLINDKEGVQLFMTYLKSEGLEHLLEFWFACEGLKSNETEDKEKIRKLINIIFKKFIRNSKTIKLSDKVRLNLKQELSTDSEANTDRKYDRNIFDSAQQEVEEQLKSGIYGNFLQSSLYIDCIQSIAFNSQCLGATGGYDDNSPKEPTVSTTNSSIGSMETSLDDYSARNQYYDVLPTLHEDSELQTINTSNNRIDSNLNNRSQAQHKLPALPVDDCHNLMSSGSSDTLMRGLNRIMNQRSATSVSTTRMATETHPLSPNQSRVSPAFQSYQRFRAMANPPNPYHVKYSTVLPTSAQDSELQSISSHSTNDSMSCVSGTDGTDNPIRTRKQMHLAIKHNAKLNSNANNMNPNRDLLVVMQSRTLKPLPTSANDASHPEKFALTLIEKLERIKKERDSHESNDKKLAEVLQTIGTDLNNTNNKPNVNPSLRPPTANPTDNSNCRPNMTFKEVLCKQKFEFCSPEDDDQSILDKHCAQVFSETPNETPTDSIGRCSSPPKLTYRPFYDPKPVVSSPPVSMPSTHSNSSFEAHVVVTVHYSTEQMPYLLRLPGPHITLRKFKQQIPAKRGNWQYFFKRKCDDRERMDTQHPYVLEKITDDNVLLPLIDGKIFAELQESKAGVDS